MSLKPTISRNANDTYVVAGIPAANYAGAATILTKSAGSGSECRGLIYFPRTFPLGATILSAKVSFYQVGAEAGSHTIQLQRIITGWPLSTTNWNNQPTSTATGAVTLTKGAAPDGTEWEFDVTAQMQTVSNGGVWGGWKILSTTDDYLSFYSSQAVLKPVLVVQWSDKPNPPTALSPAGNRATALAKPVLRFDFTDVSGDTNLQAVQVQINATNVWTAPTFDSGTVTTTTPELDLNTTAYAGLAAAASTYWRVRVQDGAGLWSDWSLGAQFQRQTKGTLTLTNPPVSGLISEPTPPIIWTFTGRTQSAWQVFITPAADATTTLYNTGKIAGTALSTTLPAGVLKDDQAYMVHLRVWDTIAREATPNDTPWVYVSRSFTYDYDATVNPVTTLAVTDLKPIPAATLTWTRATAPDSFIIRRNGVIIASGLTAAALTTGGTGYAYTDRGAKPNQNVTWSVQAVVNGKTSAANPSVVGKLQPVGIWLQDPARSLSVQLIGQDPGNWGMGELSTAHAPVGSSKSVLITQALRGFEGNVAAEIMDTSVNTVAQKEATLWLLKSTPGRVYTLTLSDMTIPVVIGNVVVRPLPGKEIVKAVSFDFWQTGDLPFTANL